MKAAGCLRSGCRTRQRGYSTPPRTASSSETDRPRRPSGQHGRFDRHRYKDNAAGGDPEVTMNDGPGVPPERAPETTSVFRADFLSEVEPPPHDQPISGVDALPAGSRP